MIHAVGCSILQPEIDAVLARLRLEGDDVGVTYLDSALHMKPRMLEKALGEQLALTRQEPLLPDRGGQEAPARQLILFGDCCAGMTDFEKSGHVRVAVPNCMFWLLGRERYRTLIRQGAFFVQREWAERWQHVFLEELGLSEESLAKVFFADMHRFLLYLDTGIEAVPTARLQEMSAFTGLPIRVEAVSLEPLENRLREALAKLRGQPDGQE